MRYKRAEETLGIKIEDRQICSVCNCSPDRLYRLQIYRSSTFISNVLKELHDIIIIFGKCNERLRKKLHYKPFCKTIAKLESKAQIRPSKPVGKYLFIKFFSNIILIIILLSSFIAFLYKTTTTH